ncbi:acyl-CoA dehydrogenase [Mycolicibacterium mucogenicum]|uniref:Acyl-CoA dehydrogenase n=1 Tax=Mycolicibacterium mucogenicum TaxID=56689 RepID=A0A1A3HFU6_MYCMU|nr:acyl-CoA dehydrogenase family protein [Mycolicibacterium mucogenicum]OBJ46456.1 acyl-CoA dehydrogenase [Mycolicibacterium mucogenicum]
MKRTIFTNEHDQFRALARSFLRAECTPHIEAWESQGLVPREVWTKAGDLSLLGWEAAPEFGGLGISDYRYNAVLAEECIDAGAGSLGSGMCLHNDTTSHYLLDLTNDEQKGRWLPGWCSGELITAVAMTEPAAGSDLRSIRTTARRDGDHYVVNGSKTFITNGILADAVICAVKTDTSAGHRGISLVVIERGMAGFRRGRNLDKVGQKSQDTAELFFDDVRVPAANLLGEEGRGFYYLMGGLPQERLGVSVAAVAMMGRAIALTKQYVRERQAFGGPLGALQHVRFELAEVHTCWLACQAYLDHAIMLHIDGQLSAEDAAGLKQWTTDRQCEVVDRCLQLHGGYGYMNEYEIARLWRDGRVARIYGGANEVMKEVVGRALRLDTADA